MSSDTGNNQENWPLYLAILLVIPVVDLLTGSNLPYGYFMLLRVLATAGFAYIAFQTYSSDEELLGIKYFLVFGAAAVLYNPILPIYLPREIWTVINLATAILVFLHWEMSKQGNFEKEKISSLQQNPVVRLNEVIQLIMIKMSQDLSSYKIKLS